MLQDIQNVSGGGWYEYFTGAATLFAFCCLAANGGLHDAIPNPHFPSKTTTNYFMLKKIFSKYQNAYPAIAD